MKNIAKLTSYGCYLDCDFVTAKYPEDETHIVGNVAEYVYDLEQKISDLEAKLAESNESHHKNIVELTKMATEKDRKIEELKQQLAEKDKLLREKIGSLKTTDFIRLCLDCGFMVDAKDKDNQDKISFAVEQLEKVKDDINTYNKEHCFLSTEIDTCNKSAEIIDNQIKQLKEMK